MAGITGVSGAVGSIDWTRQNVSAESQAAQQSVSGNGIENSVATAAGGKGAAPAGVPPVVQPASADSSLSQSDEGRKSPDSDDLLSMISSSGVQPPPPPQGEEGLETGAGDGSEDAVRADPFSNGALYAESGSDDVEDLAGSTDLSSEESTDRAFFALEAENAVSSTATVSPEEPDDSGTGIVSALVPPQTDLFERAITAYAKNSGSASSASPLSELTSSMIAHQSSEESDRATRTFE